MIVQPASPEDAEEILTLQKLAYMSEAEIYGDFSIQPLKQTVAEILDEFRDQLFLKACIDGRIVGSVRAGVENETCRIGKLIVHPDFRGRGIATRLMSEIEGCFREVGRYELFTGHRSEQNLRLYDRLGYTPFASRPVAEHLTMIFLEKPAAHKSKGTS